MLILLLIWVTVLSNTVQFFIYAPLVVKGDYAKGEEKFVVLAHFGSC